MAVPQEVKLARHAVVLDDDGHDTGSVIWMATPTGTVDGVNVTFILAYAPSPSSGLMLFKNGLLQRPGLGNDFTLSGLTVTFESDNVPSTGDVLACTYPH